MSGRCIKLMTGRAPFVRWRATPSKNPGALTAATVLRKVALTRRRANPKEGVMGFLSRLFGLDSKKDVELEAAEQPVEPGTPMVRVTTQLRMETPPFLELAGTTTNSAENCRLIMQAAGCPDGGLLYRDGQIVAESHNAVDPDAIAIHIDGLRVGYLQKYSQQGVQHRAGELIPVQMWARPDRNGLRVKAIAYLGPGEPDWPHDAANPYPVTREEQAVAEQRRMAELRVERLLSDDPRVAGEQQSRLVRGKDYTEWPATIEQLKREGKLSQALDLLYECIEATERADPASLPPWFTTHAAIVHRKLGQLDEEIAVLQRYDARTNSAMFADRIAKTTALRAKKGYPGD